jgi:diguanylate cyclase (GGDEF)-like protein
MMKVLGSLPQPGKVFWVTIGFLSLFVVGALDYLTGNEISFSLFYVFPIALIARVGDRNLGSASAIVSAGIWLLAEIMVGHSYSHPAILYWNAFVRLAIFLLVAFSIELGRSLERESAMARTDFVTGALNSRSFHEQLKIEIERASRYAHAFTIVYLDIDDFKTVNDHFGHTVGDQVLRAVVRNLSGILRKTDVVARVGGDEFAVLLPETGSDAARTVVSKAFKDLCDKMEKDQHPISFSAGAITFVRAPPSVDAALDLADMTMYKVKTSGKNNIAYEAHE